MILLGSLLLKMFFHLMIVIPIETTNLLSFFRTLQLSANKPVLRTVAGLDAQPAVGPELLIAAPVRESASTRASARSNRTDAWNLPQQFHGLMFPALC
jgi:hypothetical protein